MDRKRALVFWFTGLSGSGKTTIAESAKQKLEAGGRVVLILDGDSVRAELHRHLGFNDEDIKTNNALIADLCRKHRSQYDAILVPIISPFAESRSAARLQLSPGFFEIYCSADLDVVSARDVKGLYAKAALGQIDNMIGSPQGVVYEPPASPDLRLDTANEGVEQTIESFCGFALRRLGPEVA